MGDIQPLDVSRRTPGRLKVSKRKEANEPKNLTNLGKAFQVILWIM